MVDLGESIRDQGFLMLNSDGTIPWMNEFGLSTLGYSLIQLKTLTVFDLVPENFHEILRNIFAEKIQGKDHKYSIWPFKSSDGDIVWWYTISEGSEKWWYRAIQLDKTTKSGSKYASMMVTMNLVNNQNEIRSKFEDHLDKFEKDLKKLEEADNKLNIGINDIRTKFSFATSAMEKAATASLRASSDIAILRTEIREAVSKHTMEIINLINNDATHVSRMESYERHLTQITDKAVDAAMKKISDKTESVGTEIVIRANNVGKSLTKKVTVPVGAIAFIMTVFQFILSNWKTIFP